MSIPQTVLEYPPLERWQNFFDTFRQFPIEEETPKQFPLPDMQKATAFFTDFRKQYDTFVKEGGTINVWEIAKLRWDEVRNCNVLNWLLDCKGSHAQGDFFFKCFLNCLAVNPLTNNDIGNNYRTNVEQTYTTIQQADESANAEQCITASSDRVDFVIENDRFLLFIEAKIYAGEGYKQLERYSSLLKARAGKRKNELIFLTKTGYKPNVDYPISPISWRQIAMSFEKAMKEQLPLDVYGTVNQPLWAALAQQFCYHIKKF